MGDSKITPRALKMKDHELRLIAGAATHQHYKGGLYRLIGPIKDAATGLPLVDADGNEQVAYEHLWPHERGHWVRSGIEFFDSLETPDWHPYAGVSERIYRFRAFGKGWAA